MVEKELIKEFLKQFKVALTNAGIYFKGHPALLSSADKARSILERIFFATNPFFIGITPDSLLIEGERLTKDKLYIDLAHHFHCRKIKSITFAKGVNSEEFSVFLLIVASSFKDIAKADGIKQWMSKENIKHIEAGELDYSELLGESSGEDKDIWKFLIEKAYQKKSFSSDLDKLSEHFDKIIYKFSSSDLKEDPYFVLKIIETLHYMRDKNPQRFKSCSKTLVKFILDRNEPLNQEDIAAKVKEFLKGIDDETLGDIIWEYNFDNKRFDSFSLELFSRLLDNDSQTAVAGVIENRFIANKDKFNDAETRENLEGLVSSFNDKVISKVYKNTLSNLLRNIDTKGSFSLGEEYIYENYMYSLLNLIYLEDKELRLEVIASAIIKEWGKAVAVKDTKLIRYIVEVLDKKIQESDNEDIKKLCRDVKTHIVPSLENIILNNSSTLREEDINFFSNLISSSKFGADAYIAKIVESGFSQKKLVKLFLKFFPNDTRLLFDIIRDRISSFESSRRVINILKDINTVKSLEFLIDIFGIANPMLRRDILRAMQNMSVMNEEFIFKVLKGKDIFLKKEALTIIVMRAAQLKQRALKYLLNIFNPLGIRNDTLISNIRIIVENNVKEAIPELKIIGKRYYLWHARDLKKTIQEALKKLDKDG